MTFCFFTGPTPEEVSVAAAEDLVVVDVPGVEEVGGAKEVGGAEEVEGAEESLDPVVVGVGLGVVVGVGLGVVDAALGLGVVEAGRGLGAEAAVEADAVCAAADLEEATDPDAADFFLAGGSSPTGGFLRGRPLGLFGGVIYN